MKLPLIAACLVAGSTWSFANADVTASTSNQKTAPRPYPVTQASNSARGQETAKSDAQPKKVTPASKQQAIADKEAQNLQLKQAATQVQAQQRAAQQQAALRAKRAAMGGQQNPAPHPMVVAAPTNDDCSTPIVIVGTGTFGFDNTGATTGVDGQSESACNIYGSTTIVDDVWLQWVAPSSGIATWDGCGGGTIDTKVAAYAGAGCPTPGTALACDDDFCGFPWQSRIQFNV